MDEARLLTHVLLQECDLPMVNVTIIEPTEDGEGITVPDNVPRFRSYAAGSLVHDDLAYRLIEAGYDGVVVKLERAVVAVAREDTEDENGGEIAVEYVPTVEPVESW